VTLEAPLAVQTRVRARAEGHPATRVPSAVYALGITVLMWVLWWIGSEAHWWRELVLPSPGRVFAELRTFVGSSQFWGDIGTTCYEVLLSLLLGCVLGGVLGAVFWWLPLLGRSLESYVVSFYSVPLIVLYPVMIVLVGITPWSLILLNTVVVMIPVLLNVWIGLESTPPGYLKLGRSMRLSGFRLLFTLALPSASRQVAAGVQIAASVAISAAVGMEFLMAPQGMGFRVRFYYESLDSSKMIAYVVALFILAVVLVGVLGAVEKRVLRRLHVD
jgi:NitT/TauT family transport system permease protein